MKRRNETLYDLTKILNNCTVPRELAGFNESKLVNDAVLHYFEFHRKRKLNLHQQSVGKTVIVNQQAERILNKLSYAPPAIIRSVNFWLTRLYEHLDEYVSTSEYDSGLPVPEEFRDYGIVVRESKSYGFDRTFLVFYKEKEVPA